MNVIQLSVFIDNMTGLVSELTDVLGTAGINIRGFSVSDTVEHGTVRLVVDDPAAAKLALTAAGFTVEERPVVCLELPDSPGGLARVLKVVAEAGVAIEYVYSLISAYVVINVADVDRAILQLQDQPVRLVSQEEIAGI